MKKRNLVFTVLFCLFLLGPAGVFVADKVGIDLPGWLTAQDSRYLSGGIEEASVGRSMSVEGFGTKRLQDAIEVKIGNNVPMKATALLANAALQCSAIGCSNMLFKWDCYPTYYGSSKLYIPDSNALSRMPFQKPQDRTAAYLDSVRLINNVAESYPHKRFLIYVPDYASVAQTNPAVPLVSQGIMSVSQLVEMGKEELTADNVEIIGHEYVSLEEYYQKHYTTDHHWNGFGCIDAFKDIAYELNYVSCVADVGSTIEPSGQVMNGSNSRLGLKLLNEQIKEPGFDLSNVRLTEGASAPVLTGDVKLLESKPMEEEFDFYHAWYGKGGLQAHNETMEAGDKVLMVGDSYTYSLRWLMATACKELKQVPDFVDGRPKVLERSGMTLKRHLDEFDADTVMFVAASNDYGQMATVYPGYFD